MKTLKKLALPVGGLVLLLVVLGMVPSGPSQLTHTVTINAPLQEVYSTLLAIDNVNEWVVPVHEAHYVGNLKAVAGAERECTLADGSVVRETVVEALPNKLIRMRMTEHELPVHFFEWDIATEALSATETQVTQHTRYHVKFGLLGSLLDGLVVKSDLDATLSGAYQGLKNYVEQTPTQE